MKKMLVTLAAVLLMLSIVCSASAANTLKIGDRGAAVRALQTALVNQGWADLRVDGVYGKATAAAVKYYQRMTGLNVSAAGNAGPVTLQRLIGTSEVDVTPSGTSTLTRGASGAAVAALQRRLQALGYPVGKIDGKFGRQTYKAVVLFQQLNGIKADGKVGGATSAKLYAADVQIYRVQKTYAKLKRGDSGERVKTLQNTLKQKGYYGGVVTGYYSFETFVAVKNFQTDSGLRADGVAGQQTLTALYK